MCGIAGTVNLDGAPADAGVVAGMAAAIAHRGPDGQGEWVEGPVGFGHRRLAIIDLSDRAVQPMVSADERHVIVYNGEIYNYLELRAELEDAGHRFRSASDTEVVLTALAAWGRKALLRFNGMFALALFDRHARTLMLARDRYGIKPLYIARRGRLVAFGSEVKALLAHPAIEAEMDLEALVEYLTFQNYFSNRTLFRGIGMLPPGTCEEIRLDTGASTRYRYWDFCFRPVNTRRSQADTVEEFLGLFDQAVTRTLRSDVPVGSYLSGGLDTGAIATLAARRLPGLQTFTIGFDLRSASGLELAFDERAAAEHLSYLCGSEHYEMVLKAGDMERAMPALIRHLEEPRIGQSYPNFYAAKLASSFGRVVLSGTGGDELFGGYPWRYHRGMGDGGFQQWVDRYYAYWQRLIPNGLLPQVMAPVWDKVGHVDCRQLFCGVFDGTGFEAPTSPEDCVGLSMYLEAKTFLHGLLVVEDKLSMAHGLESRLPFLDNDVVDFAVALPTDRKLKRLDSKIRIDENLPGSKTDHYFSKTKDGKLLLRQAFASLLPEETANGPKQGFSGPDASWFRGESLEFVRRIIFDDRSAIFDVLDPAAVRPLVSDHLAGTENRRLLLWSLLSLEQWCRTFLGRGP